MLIINDKKENIEALAEILPAIDVPSSQVLIEAKVVEIMISDGMQRNLSIMFQGDRYKTGAQTQIPGNTSPTTSGATSSRGWISSSRSCSALSTSRSTTRPSPCARRASAS